MNKDTNLQLVKSGNPLVEIKWGGFYNGGTYFTIGTPNSGKTILGLQFATKARSKNDPCLYITTSKINDLLINSSVIDLDLQNYIDKGIIILTRLAVLKNIKQIFDVDSNLRDYFKDLRKLIELYSPARIVVDEITSLIEFDSLNLFSELFLHTKNYLQERGITSLWLLTENIEKIEVSSSILKLSTAFINLSKSESHVNKLNPGIMTITPIFGHSEGKFSSKYYIKVHVGIEIVRK